MAERKTFLLRIDAKLWEEIERWAQDELRSVNGQVEYLLRQAVVARRHQLPPSQEEARPDPTDTPPGSAP